MNCIHLDGQGAYCAVSYEVYIHQITDAKGERYHRRKIKALSNLIKCVMENELTDLQREAVQLVKVQGLTIKEAAQVLKVNASTIHRHLQLADKKFDRAWAHYKSVEKFLYNEE